MHQRCNRCYDSTMIAAEEFTAHSDTVNCVSIGRKSGRVMATGGDDKNVNIWTVGQPNVVMVRARVLTCMHPISAIILPKYLSSSPWPADADGQHHGHRRRAVRLVGGGCHWRLGLGRHQAVGAAGGQRPVLSRTDALVISHRDLVARSLSGHTSNIKCLDFHPFGEFIASGSLDTNIRVRTHSHNFLFFDQ